MTHMPQSTSRPLIIQTEHLAIEPAAWLADRAQLERCEPDDARFSGLLADAKGLVIRTYTHVDTRLLEQAPKLRVVGRAGVGLDNIDLDACRHRDIAVVHTPDANTQAVIEYVTKLILDSLRPICAPMHRAIGDDLWKQVRADTVGRHELAERTVGILGLGRIGKRLAKVMTAFGSRVVYCDLLDIPIHLRSGAMPVSVAELFEQSDILSIHVDGRAENRHCVGEHLMDRMKADALLINTSRGFVMDTDAVARWLTGRPDAHAILDVHDPEPIGDANPLLTLPNATLLPHLASRTQRAMTNMSWVVRDVWAVLEGQSPQFPAPISQNEPQP